MSLWQLCTAVWRKGERMSDTEAVFRLLCMMCSLIHYKETESSFASFVSTAYQIKLVLQKSSGGESLLS